MDVKQICKTLVQRLLGPRPRAIHKSAVPGGYLESFRDRARRALPEWQYRKLHLQARGAAGGRAPRVSALQPYAVDFDPAHFTPEQAAAWLEAQGLGGEVAQGEGCLRAVVQDGTPVRARKVGRGVTVHLGARLDGGSSLGALLKRMVTAQKSFPGASLHVPVPLGSDKERQNKVAKADTDAALATAALAAETGQGDMSALHMQRLIAGIDALVRDGVATSPQGALPLAADALADDPNVFDDVAVGELPELVALPGLDLDIGSGAARHMGCLGLDLEPYDHATLVHDVRAGLPFMDHAARTVRLTYAMDDILEGGGDALALLSEIERVLMPGGLFMYQGPRPILIGVDWQDYLPGLEQLSMDRAPTPGSPVRQVFARRDHQADSSFYGVRPTPVSLEDFPLEALLAQTALDATQPPPDTEDAPPPITIGKASGPSSVPIVKADTFRRIVYGVVLAPNELDTQDDYMEPKEIEDAAHNYLIDARVVGSEHMGAIKAVPVESYIAPADFVMSGQYGEQVVKKGSWVLAVKILDDKEWQKVLNGEYSGFSVGGFGLRDKT